jgi:hypothetical protein
MSMTVLEQERHAHERGEILRVLKDAWGRDLVTVASLIGTLDRMGHPLSEEGLEFHLVYLEAQGYLKIMRARDLPGYRRDRLRRGEKPTTIRFVKLEAKGLQLIDGAIAEDPLVHF